MSDIGISYEILWVFAVVLAVCMMKLFKKTTEGVDDYWNNNFEKLFVYALFILLLSGIVAYIATREVPNFEYGLIISEETLQKFPYTLLSTVQKEGSEYVYIVLEVNKVIGYLVLFIGICYVIVDNRKLREEGYMRLISLSREIYGAALWITIALSVSAVRNFTVLLNTMSGAVIDLIDSTGAEVSDELAVKMSELSLDKLDFRMWLVDVHMRIAALSMAVWAAACTVIVAMKSYDIFKQQQMLKNDIIEGDEDK